MRYLSNYYFVLGFCVICAFVVFSDAASAQSHHDRMRPQWLNTVPQASNNTYSFQKIRVQAKSMTEAKRKLPDQAALYLSRSYNVRGVTMETTDMVDVYRDGKRGGYMKTAIKDTVFTETQMITVKLHIVDEYIDENEYHFLCAMTNPNCSSIKYDQVKLTTAYGGLGLWRSAIVPGWGQMYKGSWLKGGLILGGSVALAGGALTCELMRGYNFAEKSSNHNSTSVKQQYYARVNMLKTGMYCCLGGLAALYVYNLIDAIVAPGARRIIVYPAVTDNGSIGLGGSITF